MVPRTLAWVDWFSGYHWLCIPVVPWMRFLSRPYDMTRFSFFFLSFFFSWFFAFGSLLSSFHVLVPALVFRVGFSRLLFRPLALIGHQPKISMNFCTLASYNVFQAHRIYSRFRLATGVCDFFVFCRCLHWSRHPHLPAARVF